MDSDFTAFSLLGWYADCDVRISENEHFLAVSITTTGGTRFFPPLVAHRAEFEGAVERIWAHCRENGENPYFINLVDWQAEAVRRMGFCTVHVRNVDEYIYRAHDLCTLAGKRYHAKRNFINGFQHEFRMESYQPHHYAGVMALMREWNSTHIGKDEFIERTTGWLYCMGVPASTKNNYTLECEIVEKVLPRLAEYNCFCDVLLVEGALAGFCIGEIMPNGAGCIHAQKADVGYKGIYSLLDNLFFKKRFAEVEFVTKQEDMGIEGIRKSKLSYYPCCMVQKFDGFITNDKNDMIDQN